MPTPVPKDVLIRAIIQVTPEEAIRSHFNIHRSTDLEARLYSFLKHDLEIFLRSLPTGPEKLREIEAAFPFSSPRTFFLMRIRRYDPNGLESTVGMLAKEGRESQLIPRNNRVIRSVFVADEPLYLNDWKLIEIPLFYEEKIEYVVADPKAENYGESTIIYSLERGLIWLMEDYSHGIICCSGNSAMRAIKDYGQQMLGLYWFLPNLTDEIYGRLTSGGRPSTATFSGIRDVPTITIYAKDLPEQVLFRLLEDDPDRYVKAAYLQNPEHPLLSYGVSRNPARIWSPRKFSKPKLIFAARDIIRKTEDQLENESQRNLLGFVTYFDDAQVEIRQGKPLKGADREVFSELMAMILLALRTGQQEIEHSLLKRLIDRQNNLGIQATASIDCRNCGGGLGRCHVCMAPYDVRLDDKGDIYLACPYGHVDVRDDTLTR